MITLVLVLRHSFENCSNTTGKFKFVKRIACQNVVAMETSIFNDIYKFYKIADYCWGVIFRQSLNLLPFSYLELGFKSGNNFGPLAGLKGVNGRFYTRDALPVWTSFGKNFVIRPVIRL